MLSRPAVLLLAIGVTGCIEPSAPSFFAAEFVLIDGDGLGVPVTNPDVHGMPGSQLIAGSMSLDGGGAGYIFEERVDSQNNHFSGRSEERRVGKECRSRWSP